MEQDARNNRSYDFHQPPNPSATSRVASWIKSRKSETLAIVDTKEACRENAFSRLSQLLPIHWYGTRGEASKSTFILSFFCGLHTDNRDPLQGPRGMLRSLLFQLLSQHGLRDGFEGFTHFMPSERWTGIARHELTDLLWLFRDFVSRSYARARRIICVIDGIAKFEKDARPCATDLVMHYPHEEVVGMNADGHFGTRFKLLVTTPKLSPYSQSWLPDEVQVRVPSDTPRRKPGAPMVRCRDQNGSTRYMDSRKIASVCVTLMLFYL